MADNTRVDVECFAQVLRESDSAETLHLSSLSLFCCYELYKRTPFEVAVSIGAKCFGLLNIYLFQLICSILVV